MERPIVDEAYTGQILAAAIEVHRVLGPGLLESAYEECLCFELAERGVSFARHVELPVIYKGNTLGAAYYLNILVEDAVVLEVKAVEKLSPLHEAQLLTYLRLSKKRVGLMLNFNVDQLQKGILRRVL